MLHSRRITARAFVPAAGLTLVALTAGCSGHAATSAGGSSAEQALQSTVQKYSDAYLSGDDATAFELLSERCKRKIGQQMFGGAVAMAKEQYGGALHLTSYTAQTRGSTASVTYTYEVKTLDQVEEPWRLESGSWHDDDC